jgi:glutaminyl-tRNA synthetase
VLLCRRYAYPITVTGYSTAADGSISEVQAEADLSFVAGGGKKPPKGVLNWVAQPQPGQDPERAEVRGCRLSTNMHVLACLWLQRK